jgi:S1-C subfamily serine protease
MSQTLVELSRSLAAVVESAAVSVVRVEARRRMPASGIIWSADGLIVTAHHVIEQDDTIGIGLPDGGNATAVLVGRDPSTDLALLRVQARGLRPADWIDAAALKVGHLALALGRPAESVMATLGIVSALHKAWRTPAGGELDYYLQSDVVMYPGFSGGPLISAAGEVMGVNSSALLRGVSLTIPAVTVRRVIEMLLTHGRVRRGYLGVSAQVVRLPASLAQQIEQETGLLLGSVEPDSPAERAGLFMGDTIIALDGQPVCHLDDLLALLSGERVGASVQARIVRGGQAMDVAIVIGEQA